MRYLPTIPNARDLYGELGEAICENDLSEARALKLLAQSAKTIEFLLGELAKVSKI